ncbi:MAG: hypothetical protein KDK70_36020, partial [Myxococcales bacterium]|nr:hypothetical protein [Myxococcales bacterium]
MTRQAPLLLVLLAACGVGTTVDDAVIAWPEVVAGSCDPTDPSVCALPWPSSHFLVADESSGTGVRLGLAADTLPITYDDIQVDPFFWNERDGFSINSAAITYLEDRDLSGTITVDDIGAYLQADAKTVILDAETGERHPHWVELDTTTEDEGQQVVILRPAKPYEWGRRYVVALRGGIGKSSPAFAALRDDTQSDLVPDVRRTHYEDNIFPVLEEAGIDRSGLVLAWDFVTASREGTLGRQEWILQDMEAWYAEGPDLGVQIEADADKDCSKDGENIFRDIRGSFNVPLYMQFDQPEDPLVKGPEALLTRDAKGQPFRNGTSRADFVARIPCSVAQGLDGSSGPFAAPVLQYGHGLLGDKGEARTGWLARMADTYGFVIFAMDWTGFMEDDVPGITFMLASANGDDTNPSHFAIIPERSMQGMMEQVLGLRVMREVLSKDPLLAVGSTPVVDPGKGYYLGNSQGGILGAALLAMSPDLERGVLGVVGGPYSLLLPRSKDFDPFFAIFRNKLVDHRETMLFVVGLTQQLWDPTEPGGWMWDLARDATKPKRTLMQVAIYDNQVTTLGAHYMARAYDAKIGTNAVRDVWGVEAVDLGGEGYEG